LGSAVLILVCDISNKLVLESVAFWFLVSSNQSSHEAALKKYETSLALLPTRRVRAWTALYCAFIATLLRSLLTNLVSFGGDFALISPFIRPFHKTKSLCVHISSPSANNNFRVI